MIPGMSTVTVTGVDDWAAVCSRSFVPLSVQSGDDQFRASLASVRLTDEVSVTRVRSTGSQVIRDHAMIRRHPRDDLLISIQGRGSGAIVQADRRAAISGGHAALYDSSRPYVLDFPGPMSEIVLQVPRSALHVQGAVVAEIAARPMSPQVGSMAVLTSLLCGVFDEVGRSAMDASGERIAVAVLDLLRSTIRAQFDTGQPGFLGRDATRASVLHFIEANYLDPSVTPTVVATRHNVSLRQLQVLLAEIGHSPAGLIRRLRLDHGLALLERGASVGLAAVASGFDNAGTFTRAFKQTFERLPSDVRTSAEA